MRSFFKYILLFSSFFWLAHASLAQKKISLMGIRAGSDVSYLASTLFNENVTQFEVNGDIDLNRYLISYAYGAANLNRTGETFDFNTRGTYYKVGIDVNFINNLEGHNAVFFGIRYAHSNFISDLSRVIESPAGGSFSVDVEEDLTSFWFEALVGLKVNVWQNINLGFTLSNRFLNTVNGETELIAYEVPGYGHAEAGSLWRFNYFVQYYLPFKKEKAPAQKQ